MTTSASNTNFALGPRSLGSLVAAVGLLLVVGSLPTSAFAEYPSLRAPSSVEKPTTDDVAVVFAVEDYAFLPDVDGAVRNADAWENFFREGLGIEQTFVRTDSDVTRGAMLDFVERARDAVDADGRLWFVFIGHGAPTPDGSDGLLVGVDAQGTPESLASRGLKRSQLLDELGRGRQQESVVVIDACFSGRTGGGAPLADGLQPVVPTEERETSSTNHDATVLTAAQSDQFAGALPGGDRPAFSYLLLGALYGWADDGDENVTVDEALRFTREKLRRLDHEQEPYASGDRERILTRGASEADPGLDGLMAAARQNRASRETEPTSPPSSTSEEACPDGKIRSESTAGHCCWPGQGWNGHRCVGTPTRCPSGRKLDEETNSCELEACTGGKIRAMDGVHCCWPNQAWSSAKEECVGEPKCPEGMIRSEDQCLRDSDGDKIPDSRDRCPETPEDADGVEDDDGCPEEDADGDGLADDEDECPLQPEDVDGFRDDDGCPDAKDGSLTAQYAVGGTGAGLLVVGSGLATAGALMNSALRSELDRAQTTDVEAGRTYVDGETISQGEAIRRERRIRAFRTLGYTGIGVGSAALTGALIAIAVDADRPFWANADVGFSPTSAGAQATFRWTFH